MKQAADYKTFKYYVAFILLTFIYVEFVDPNTSQLPPKHPHSDLLQTQSNSKPSTLEVKGQDWGGQRVIYLQA